MGDLAGQAGWHPLGHFSQGGSASKKKYFNWIAGGTHLMWSMLGPDDSEQALYTESASRNFPALANVWAYSEQNKTKDY